MKKLRVLGDPFDSKTDLTHGTHRSSVESPAGSDTSATESIRAQSDDSTRPLDERAQRKDNAESDFSSDEALVNRIVESAVIRAMFGHNDVSRRRFLDAVGRSTFSAALASVFPLTACSSAVNEELPSTNSEGEQSSNQPALEQTDLQIGFVPITCATPIIMAHPMGFYSRYGLNVEVVKTAGWAVSRDKSLSGEYDAAHMLTPMPLAITLGAGSTAQPFLMPAVENINGQAITLHMKHRDKRNPSDWRGFKFAVPFEYSMHNFLLRYYLAENGVDPDQDVQIRVLPPPEMVANLRAENVDGYLAPDPFNQRAVYENVGFIHLLSKEIWDGHPCCAFAIGEAFTRENPRTFAALFKAIIDATKYSSDPSHRSEIAAAIAPRNYLNQPETVVEQVLTGRYADGLGEVKNVPDRIDFDPFPWHSMGVWILSQMKRWGYIEGDVDYRSVAERVYLATDCGRLMRELGYEPPSETYQTYSIMGKTFDPAEPEAYVSSFEIRRGA